MTFPATAPIRSFVARAPSLAPFCSFKHVNDSRTSLHIRIRSMVNMQSPLDTEAAESQRWAGIYKLLDRSSLIHPEFEPVPEV